MNMLCKIFGHESLKSGWWGDGLYGKVSGGHRDNIGRSHYRVHRKCNRCGEEHIVARFHGNAVARAELDHALKDITAHHEKLCEMVQDAAETLEYLDREMWDGPDQLYRPGAYAKRAATYRQLLEKTD